MNICWLCNWKKRTQPYYLSSLIEIFNHKLITPGMCKSIFKLWLTTQNNLTLAETLFLNQENQMVTFIHNSCRNKLRNLSRRKQPLDGNKKSNKRRCLRRENKIFDFKKQCFYYNGTCIVDTKHPDRNKFEEVRTKDTTIYKQTLNICKIRKDNLAKHMEFCLLYINDLVAEKQDITFACRKNFESRALFQ